MTSWQCALADGRTLRVRATTRADGNFDFNDPNVVTTRASVVARPWIVTTQVHGAQVVVVEDEHLRSRGAGEMFWAGNADAIVTARSDIALSVRSADCATAILVADNGYFAAVHCGWKGVVANVFAATAQSLRQRGAQSLQAYVAATIGPECYEFDEAQVLAISKQLHVDVSGQTAWETPALDMPKAVAASCAQAGIDIVARVDQCTGCHDGLYWSHRRRQEEQRQGIVAWIE